METKVLNARTKIERRAEPPTYRQQVTKAINPATFELLGSVPMTPEGQARSQEPHIVQVLSSTRILLRLKRSSSQLTSPKGQKKWHQGR